MIHLSGWVAPTRNLQLLHPLAVQRQPCTVTGQAMKCYSHHWACREYTYTSCVTSLTCIINETHNIHWNFTFRMIHSITGTSQHITSDSLLIITLTLGSCSWQILAAMSEFLSVGLVRAYLEALMRRPTTEEQAQRIMSDNMLLLGRNGSFRCESLCFWCCLPGSHGCYLGITC